MLFTARLGCFVLVYRQKNRMSLLAGSKLVKRRRCINALKAVFFFMTFTGVLAYPVVVHNGLSQQCRPDQTDLTFRVLPGGTGHRHRESAWHVKCESERPWLEKAFVCNRKMDASWKIAEYSFCFFFATELLLRLGTMNHIPGDIRFVHMLRIVRVGRFCYSFRPTAYSIAPSMMSLVWVLVLLSFVMYSPTIFYMNGVIDQFAEAEDMGSKLSKSLAQYFSTFVFYAFFMIFGEVNVVVAYFVDSAVEIESMKNSDCDKFRSLDFDVSTARTLFKLLDRGNSNSVEILISSQISFGQGRVKVTITSFIWIGVGVQPKARGGGSSRLC